MYPRWVHNAARISHIEVTRDQSVRSQIAHYEHGSRKLRVFEGIGRQLLNRAIGHELVHGLDDNYGSPHFFSATDEWRQIHRDQGHFDIQKYADEPLEYFADMFQKYLAFGHEKLALTHPAEAMFFAGYVEPVVRQQHGD